MKLNGSRSALGLLSPKPIKDTGSDCYGPSFRLGMEAHACNLSTWDVEGERSEVRGQSRPHETLSQPPFLYLVLRTSEGTTQRIEKKKLLTNMYQIKVPCQKYINNPCSSIIKKQGLLPQAGLKYAV